MNGAAPGADHRQALLGLGLAETVLRPLTAYLDALAAWSLRMNLSGARTPEQRVARLVAPVLPARAFLGEGSLLDVGSGNGSPGLVLAALLPGLHVTLLEPRLKRWAFLREAARVMLRADVDVRRERHSQYGGPEADYLTLRGLRLPLAELAPLVRRGGRALLFGARPAVLEPGWEPGPVIELGAGQLRVYRRCST